GVERRAELVAQRSEELVLHPVRALGVLARGPFRIERLEELPRELSFRGFGARARGREPREGRAVPPDESREGEDEGKRDERSSERRIEVTQVLEHGPDPSEDEGHENGRGKEAADDHPSLVFGGEEPRQTPTGSREEAAQGQEC